MNTQQSSDDYFSVSPGKTGVCEIEWRDLDSVWKNTMQSIRIYQI